MVGGERRARRAGAADLRRAEAGGRLRASCTPARSAPATSPRWSTTASSTAMMQAYAEGYELLAAAGLRHRRAPGLPELDRRARSSAPGCSTCWSTRWTTDPGTWRSSRGYAEDSGEGRWTVEAAIDHAVPMPVDHRRRCSPGSSRRQDDSPGDEGGRGAAQPVRRPRGHGGRSRTAVGADSLPTSTADRPMPLTLVHLSALSLTDFRSYAQVELQLEPGVTAFVGPNGQGKTNLVEAIGYLATLGSHRVAHRRAAGAPRRASGRSCAARWCATTVGDPGRARAQSRARPTGPGSTARRCRGRARCSGCCARCCSRPRIWRWSRAIPAERRRFLDDLLVARAPRFAGVRADYERVLKQRNALLKTAALARRSRARRRRPVHPRRLGRPPGPGRRASCWPRGCALVDAICAAGRQGLRAGRATAGGADHRGVPLERRPEPRLSRP